MLLIAGIIGLVTGRRRAAAVTAGAGRLPAGPTPGAATAAEPGRADHPAGPDIDPTPTRPFHAGPAAAGPAAAGPERPPACP